MDYKLRKIHAVGIWQNIQGLKQFTSHTRINKTCYMLCASLLCQTDIAYTQCSLKSMNLNEVLYLLFASSGSDLVADCS